MMRAIGSLGMLLLLAGCGAETAGTAAAQAALEAQQAGQAKQMEQSVRQRLDAAGQLEQQHLDAAAKASGD